MNKKLQTIDLLAGKLLDTLKRFPLAIFSAYLFSTILITLSTLDYSEKEALLHYDMINKISFIAALGYFLFTTLRLISRNYLLIILGFVLLIAYYLYLPVDIRNLNRLKMEFPLIIFSLFLLIIAAPYINHSTSNIKFWNWAKHVIFSFILSGIFGFILFMGLRGGLYITEKLFVLEHTNRHIVVIATFTIGIFGSYFFLSQLPKYPRLLTLKPYNNIENIFTKFILTPLFILYFIILYTYTAKIIFLGEWPNGTVSISILLFSALGILTYLFWTPLWNKNNEKYKNFFWWTILLQTFVLAIAIYFRVEPYGWTTGRYIVAVIGFWLSAISLYFIFNKKASYRAIFISLPILLMLTLFSPFSANTIAQKSQQAKLMTLLSQESNLSEESNLSLKYNISSSIEYLYEEHGIDSLFPVIPQIVTSYQNQEEELDSNDCSPVAYGEFPSYATKQVGFKYIDHWQWVQYKNSLNSTEFKSSFIPKSFRREEESNQNEDIEVKGYDWLLSFRYFDENDMYPTQCLPPEAKKSISKQTYIIETSQESITIKYKNHVLASIPIEEFITTIIRTPKKEDNDKSLQTYFEPIKFTTEEFTIYFNNSEIRVKLIFDNLELSQKDKLTHYRGQILIKKK